MRNRRRIEPYLGRLFGYALSLTGDREQSRDLVQDCAVRALGAARIPADEAAYRAWLFRILRNACIDRIRCNGRSIGECELEAAVESEAVWRFDDDMISALTVRIGLSKLAPAHREIIALVDIAGFTYGEAAALLEIPPGTVMSRLSRARQRLLDAIADDNVRSLPIDRRRIAT